LLILLHNGRKLLRGIIIWHATDYFRNFQLNAWLKEAIMKIAGDQVMFRRAYQPNSSKLTYDAVLNLLLTIHPDAPQKKHTIFKQVHMLQMDRTYGRTYTSIL
jgi:hypothetical protein